MHTETYPGRRMSGRRRSLAASVHQPPAENIYRKKEHFLRARESLHERPTIWSNIVSCLSTYFTERKNTLNTHTYKHDLKEYHAHTYTHTTSWKNIAHTCTEFQEKHRYIHTYVPTHSNTH